ncbi:NADH-cytochrome b5 reductase [Epichloe bromicola]|uniref:NADH-cytochrome b5 reductase n=1 Tax=Epichloe bromicola TaxID=79588 RepID=A0ABQ0CL75_9HYPO
MDMEAKEVAGHNEPDNAWFTTHGKVYNETEYLRDHPGGADILIEAAGTGATEAFDNAGHSKDAREMMESFLVGTLKGYRPKKPRNRPSRARTPPVSNDSDRGVLELRHQGVPGREADERIHGEAQRRRRGPLQGPPGAPCGTGTASAGGSGMVAGGTGITPMFQVIRAMCDDDRDLTRASLIYANRTEQDILLREELNSLARRYPGNPDVYYVLHHPPEDWPHGKGRVTEDLMRERLPAPEPDTRIMLCGPPGMLKAARSSLVDLGFEQPVAAARMTDQVLIF